MVKRVAGGLLALAIGWATLRPQPDTGAEALVSCLLCGPRAVADALLNVVMFVPVGLLLASVVGTLPAISIAALLSGLIETAQLAIPGRDPSLGDLLFNTVGAAAGVAMLRLGRRWVVPGRAIGAGLAAGWAAAAMAAMFLTGWLLASATPPQPYTVQWTPALRGMAQYEGRLTDALIGDVRLPPGPARDAASWASGLQRGLPVAALVVLGRPPERLAPLLTIHDGDGAEAVLLGIAGQDIVYRRQARAHRWRLDAPGVLAPGVLASYSPGDSVTIATVATYTGQCFVVDIESYCGYGYDAADGWRLLYSGESVAAPAASALGALWLALLVLPIGFWSRWRVGIAVALTAVLGWYAYVRVPVDTVLLPIGWSDALGLLLGLGAGLLLGRTAHRVVTGGAAAKTPA